MAPVAQGLSWAAAVVDGYCGRVSSPGMRLVRGRGPGWSVRQSRPSTHDPHYTPLSKVAKSAINRGRALQWRIGERTTIVPHKMTAGGGG